MKNITKSTLTILCSLLFASTVFSQNNSNSESVTKQLSYESIIDRLKQKDIPYNEKCDLINQVSRYSVEEQINLIEEFISLEKNEQDKSLLISLYCQLNDIYLSIDKEDQGKIYLDEALNYIDHSTNNEINATLFYYIGNYYTKNDDVNAFDAYWKGMSYCNKAENVEIITLKILYKICALYNKNEDVVSLKKNMDEMLRVANKINTPEAFFITYPVLGVYYIRKVNDINLSDEEYYQSLDSVYHFNEKIVEIYESQDKEFKTANASQMSIYYLNYADVMIVRDNTQWKEALNIIDKSSNLLPPTDTLLLARNMHAKSRVLFNQKKHDESIAQAMNGLKILKGYSGNTHIAYYDLYRILREVYTANKDYKNALKYEELRNDISKKITEEKQHKTVKELEVKYQTAEKELEISHLNEEKQQLLYNIAIIIGSLIVLAILLLIAFLYNRMKRLKKEKEASELSIRIKEKDIEFQSAMAQSELNSMQSYLNGLEAERERLAKELHDNVANELLSIDFQLKGVEQVPEKTTQQLGDLHSEIRNISHELMPPLFKYASLPEIISDYVSSANKKDIHIDIDMQNEDLLNKLPEKSALEIYRIIQEAVGNIIKHSEATIGKLVLQSDGERLSLTIEDNGKGFDINEKGQGIGLHIIRDRVKSLDGEMKIKTDKGCQIDISIPL